MYLRISPFSIFMVRVCNSIWFPLPSSWQYIWPGNEWWIRLTDICKVNMFNMKPFLGTCVEPPASLCMLVLQWFHGKCMLNLFTSYWDEAIWELHTLVFMTLILGFVVNSWTLDGWFIELVDFWPHISQYHGLNWWLYLLNTWEFLLERLAILCYHPYLVSFTLLFCYHYILITKLHRFGFLSMYSVLSLCSKLVILWKSLVTGQTWKNYRTSMVYGMMQW